jgi:serine/threonine protein kinase
MGPPNHTQFVRETIVGMGRYGTVFRARYKSSGRLCALKEMPKNVAGFAKEDFFVRERKALEHIEPHENIIDYYGFFEDSENAYFVLGYFGGFSLQRIMAESSEDQPSKLISRKRIKYIMKQVLCGIKHMHRNNVYHGDLKPENIIVGDSEVKVADFGCSIISETGVVGAKEVSFLGTPGFMPPEALDLTYIGKIHLKHLDIWAFGVTLYYVYTRVVPFVARFFFDTLKNVKNLSIDYSILTPGVEGILRNIFVADPSKRFGLEELEESLEHLEE